jgi:hypothetical protein
MSLVTLDASVDEPHKAHGSCESNRREDEKEGIAHHAHVAIVPADLHEGCKG